MAGTFTTSRQRAIHGRWLVALVTLCLAHPALADDTTSAPPMVLATVNGEAITAADLDSMIVATHRTAGPARMRSMDIRKLLDKAINDRLILQQALAMELDQDPDLLRRVDGKRAMNAVREYVRDAYQAPEAVSDDEVRAFFDAHYWKIGIRQLSARTREETESLRQQVLDGASMETLAGQASLDTYRHSGGRHNTKYWADLEVVLREQVRDLEIGQPSPVFAFERAFSFVRVEERLPVDEAAFATFEPDIRADLLAEARAQAWEDFVAGLLDASPVQVDSAVAQAMRDDAWLVFRGDFLERSERPALSIGSEHHVSETDLRKATSHAAMTDSQVPFETMLERGIAEKSEELVLRYWAERGGFFDSPSVMRRYEQDMETTLLETYLAEAIVNDIKFSHEEFQEYYDSHPEEFRRPDQVRLGTILVDSEERAREVTARLQDGADFDFVKKQYETSAHTTGASKWASETVFSEEIRRELATLDVGESSQPIHITQGWMVFQVEGRRPGGISPLQDVQMQIRKVMFQRKFDERMDEHLGLLKERSEIVRHDAAIEQYFGSES